MKKLKYLSMLLLAGMVASCQHQHTTHDHSSTNAEEHADHEHAAGALSYTLFTDDYELFVEFPALVVGQSSAFAAHFTNLNTYKPVASGRLTVSISGEGTGREGIVDAPASPGIFRPEITPDKAGKYRMQFVLSGLGDAITFNIPDIHVYANEEEAAHANLEEEGGDEITYLKEQTWKTDFATGVVAPQSFYTVLHTSAKVIGQPQSSVSVNAQAAGQVHVMVVRGQSVNKGDLLAVISSVGVENSLNTKLKESKIAFEKSKADLVRTRPLVEKQAVSQKDFLQISTRYQQDSLRYFQLASQVSGSGLRLTSPADGFISALNITNGQFVENGAAVMQVASQSKMMIEAYVNQADFQKVSGIYDANFVVTDSKSPISLDQLNGKVVSANAFVADHATRIPVVFSIQNNGQLMPGMYLEAFLKTGKKDNVLVAPLSAIVEEQGQYFVFVQTGGESFAKRQVMLENSDGVQVEITSGLSARERIVTTGAFQIKLAAMAGDLPLHGHTH